jgi:hypothetical protein
MDNLEERLTKTNDRINSILESEVTMYYIDIVDGKVLVDRALSLPFYGTNKGYLSPDYVKSTGEYLLGTTMTLIEEVDYDMYQDYTSRYYLIDIPDLYSLSDEYRFVSIDEVQSDKEKEVLLAITNQKQKNLV